MASDHIEGDQQPSIDIVLHRHMPKRSGAGHHHIGAPRDMKEYYVLEKSLDATVHSTSRSKEAKNPVYVPCTIPYISEDGKWCYVMYNDGSGVEVWKEIAKVRPPLIVKTVESWYDRNADRIAIVGVGAVCIAMTVFWAGMAIRESLRNKSNQKPTTTEVKSAKEKAPPPEKIAPAK